MLWRSQLNGHTFRKRRRLNHIALVQQQLVILKRQRRFKLLQVHQLRFIAKTHALLCHLFLLVNIFLLMIRADVIFLKSIYLKEWPRAPCNWSLSIKAKKTYLE